MAVVAVVARVALGVVLLVAGASKLADRGWPAAAAELGAPRWSVAAVPYVEPALGALLVTGYAQPWPAWAAAVVLVAFTVLLLVRLGQGRRPPCACFGVRSTRPIGPWSVVRNLGLVALALVAALGARPGPAAGVVDGDDLAACAQVRPGAVVRFRVLPRKPGYGSRL